MLFIAAAKTTSKRINSVPLWRRCAVHIWTRSPRSLFLTRTVDDQASSSALVETTKPSGARNSDRIERSNDQRARVATDQFLEDRIA
jgi:hypothetical protein